MNRVQPVACVVRSAIQDDSLDRSSPVFDGFIGRAIKGVAARLVGDDETGSRMGQLVQAGLALQARPFGRVIVSANKS